MPPPGALTDPAASAPTAAARLREPASDSLATAAAVPKEAPPSGPTLPSAAALLAQGIDVPVLHLELHGYGPTPAERFVFINGRKYKEGERLGEGPEVVAIEPNGVVLSQQGHRFMLAPE
jgi:general secretion pathway protein B